MKKILALVFALVLCLSLFVACSSDGESGSSSSSSSSSGGNGGGGDQTPFPAIDTVLDNLEGAGYPITRAGEMIREMVMAEFKSGLPLEGKLDEMIDAVKDEETDYLHILVFELESDAEKYYAVVLPEFEQDAAENDNIVFGRDGKIVFEGTTGAVAAAKQAN